MQRAKLILSKFVYLFTLLTLLSLLPPFAFPVFAYELKIIDAPREVSVEASASATVEFSIGSKNTQYYLATALCSKAVNSKGKEYCRYFGKTFVGSDWVFWAEKNKQNFYPVVTNEDQFWKGSVGFMVDNEDKDYEGPGDYFFRAGYFTVSGSGPNWDKKHEIPIKIIDDNWETRGVAVDDITHIRQLPKGTKIKTHGLVTVEQGPLGGDVFYLEDDFAGIKVDLPKDFESGVRLGDKVRVGCAVEESRGEKYIKVVEGDSVSIQETNLACRAPSCIATGAGLDDWEGRLVEVEGEVVETSGDTFYLDDGSGRIKVYIRESTGIDKPPMSRGDTTRVKGIISQWGQHKDGLDNYRLMLRYAEDLAVFPKVKATATAEEDTNSALPSAQVLGAADTLPATGGNLLNHILRFLNHPQPKF